MLQILYNYPIVKSSGLLYAKIRIVAQCYMKSQSSSKLIITFNKKKKKKKNIYIYIYIYIDKTLKSCYLLKVLNLTHIARKSSQ